MKCPYCSYEESKVVDSRPTDEGERIRRRRECLRCGKRFTTHEVIETVPVVVIKKDKSRETFDRNKLLNGLLGPVKSARFPLTPWSGWWTKFRTPFRILWSARFLPAKSASTPWTS